jgi:hypothetical protein
MPLKSHVVITNDYTAKNFNKVGELLPKINSAKLYLQYAKAKEGMCSAQV